MSDSAASRALKMIPYGFYALTSHTDDDDNIMVCNWFTQASFDPQLVTLALQKTSYTYGLVEKSEAFTLNLFRQEDSEAVKAFTKGRAKNPDKMRDVKFNRAPHTGCPVLMDAAAFIECKVVNIFETGGDHNLILAEVINAEIVKTSEPIDMLSLPSIGWSYAG